MSIIQENADTLRAFVLDTPGSEARDNVEKLRRFGLGSAVSLSNAEAAHHTSASTMNLVHQHIPLVTLGV